MIGTKIGRYELRDMIARTASTTVYEGWDALIARKVAVKIIAISDRNDADTRDALLRFNRGAQAAGMLNHPNIVSLYDYGETDNSAFLVMEFVNGRTLRALLEDSGRLEISRVVRIINDLAAGLAYSHAHGVVHRDIKPANLMVLANDRVKITDFGVARIDESNITQAGTMIGTPAYMSPEQFCGEAIDFRTDIYSAGIILYQMLTGLRPYDGSVATIAHKVLHSEPLAPSKAATGVSAAFDGVVRRAMAKEPDARYPSAQAFAEAVRDAAGLLGTDETKVTRPAARSNRDAAAFGAAAMPRAPAALKPRASANVWEDADASTRRRGLMSLWPAAGAVALTVGIGALALRAVEGDAPRPTLVATDATPNPNAPAMPLRPAEPPPAEPAASPPPPVALAVPPPPSEAAVEPPAARRPESAEPAAPAKPAAGSPPQHPRPHPPVEKPQVALAPPPPPAPAPAPAPAMPAPPPVKPAASERPKVRIYYLRDSPAALQQTTEIAQRLLYSDYAYSDTRSAANPPAWPEIRYFHPEDESAAIRLGELLSGGSSQFRAVGVTENASSHPLGWLEIWLGRDRQ